MKLAWNWHDPPGYPALCRENGGGHKALWDVGRSRTKHR